MSVPRPVGHCALCKRGKANRPRMFRHARTHAPLRLKHLRPAMCGRCSYEIRNTWKTTAGLDAVGGRG